MNPAIIIAAIDALISIIDAFAAKGEVTAEKVAEIKAKAKASEARWDAAVDKAKRAEKEADEG